MAYGEFFGWLKFWQRFFHTHELLEILRLQRLLIVI